MIRYTTPGGAIFDEFVYAPDACWYVEASKSLCGTGREVTFIHPPLGKWLIGAGIGIVGFSPAGWRLASILAGTATIAVTYLLGRRLFDSTLAAAVASGAVALDFLHFVLSRTAMLDVFVTFFALLSFLFLSYDRDRILPKSGAGRLDAPAGILHRPWRLAAGASAGAAAACKWSGFFALGAVIVLSMVWESSGPRQSRIRLDAVLRAARREGPTLFVGFVLLPVAVYIASYAGRLPGSLLTWPWMQGSWPRSFLGRQHAMLRFQAGLTGVLPSISPAWSWPLLKRPVVMYFSQVGGGQYQEVLALGSPLTWWTSLVALLSLGGRFCLRRPSGRAEGIILAGFVASYGPWLLGGRQQEFLYYMLPAVPFMSLALAWVAVSIARRLAGRVVIGAFVAASVALFGFYYPLLAAAPLPYRSWEARILFRDCGARARSDSEQARLKPRANIGPPPHGWCWV